MGGLNRSMPDPTADTPGPEPLERPAGVHQLCSCGSSRSGLVLRWRPSGHWPGVLRSAPERGGHDADVPLWPLPPLSPLRRPPCRPAPQALVAAMGMSASIVLAADDPAGLARSHGALLNAEPQPGEQSDCGCRGRPTAGRRSMPHPKPAPAAAAGWIRAEPERKTDGNRRRCRAPRRAGKKSRTWAPRAGDPPRQELSGQRPGCWTRRELPAPARAPMKPGRG